MREIKTANTNQETNKEKTTERRTRHDKGQRQRDNENRKMTNNNNNRIAIWGFAALVMVPARDVFAVYVLSLVTDVFFVV